MATPLRLGEFVATLALAQDNAFGQPLESQLRSCLLATWMCEAAGFDREVRDAAYWVALLRYVGCTGHAHEVATVFGDEIAIRAQTLVHDAANPAEVIRDVIAFATAGRTQEERDEIVRMIQQTAREWATHNFSSGCEVADMLVQRLDFGPACVRRWRFTFERWNGNGYPAHAKGEAIPLAMRVVHLSHDMEALGRLFSPDRALDAARDRRDRTYDPALADLFIAHGRGWFDRLAHDRAVGRRAGPRAGTPPHAGWRGARQRADGGGGLHRPEVAVHGWSQPAVRAARRRRRRRYWGFPKRQSPRSAGPRSCTTSARPPCRTRSGTSRARSHGRSSIGSSCTRC